ncbi:MAG TPA: cupin domain-containing protein [Anaeromyxobacteraceae bacterium]|nr:cupin domain-containing protein [Anaeromyxobacteraceae bacterium]
MLPARLALAASALAAVVACRGKPSASRPPASPPPEAPVVIPWEGGEHFEIGRRRSPLTIKVSHRIGSPELLMGTEEIAAGTGIPTHMHLGEDEILFVHRGQGIATVGDAEREVGTGSTIYVPRGTWHGIRNAEGTREALDVLWIFSAPGMDDYFRIVATAPGAAPRQGTDREIEEVNRTHGIRYRAP